MNHEGSSFICGCAPFTDMVFFTKEVDEVAARGIVGTTFLLWDEGIEDEASRWMKYDNTATWRAVGFATVKPPGQHRVAVAVGSKGQYFEVDPESLEERMGQISPAASGIRCVASWDHAIYAAGMGRVVLRRISCDNWVELGPSDDDVGEDEIVGFEDIDGFAANDFYAVGWQGEVWWCDGKVWKQLDAPVSGKLNAVTCGNDGLVYAVGDNGIMIRGRDEQWEALETGRPENLMDVGFFDGEVHVVTNFRIFKLVDDRLVPADNFESGDMPEDCLYLHEAEDGLVAMGSKNLFRLHEGVWKRVV